MAIRLLGDIDNALKYLSWAKSKLRNLKRHLTLFGAPMGSRRYVFDDASIYINTHHGWDLISIRGIGGAFLIISQPGTSTVDEDPVKRKYYDIGGNEIPVKAGDKPPGWQLLDDGTYGFEGTVSNDDPETNSYAYPSTDTGSLLIPTVFNGISAVYKMGSKNYRYVLNDTPEDEMFYGLTVTVQLPDTTTYPYNFCQLDDSLIYAPYKIMNNKPFVSRYVNDGIVTATQMWSGFAVTLLLRGYQTADWLDNVPVVTYMFYQPFKPTSQNARRSSKIGGSAACLAMTNFYSDKRLTQDVVRGDDWIYTPNGAVGYITAGTVLFWGNNMMEPIHSETYDLSTSLKPVVVGTEYDRSTDLITHSSYFLDGDSITGKVFDSGTQTTTNTGLYTIQNDVKKIYAVLEDGSLTYIRCQKDTEMNTWNCGLYVAGKLIEESGFLPVLKLFNDTIPPVLPYVAPEVGGCTIYVRPVNYKILQAHHEPGWNVCVYRKTVFVSNELTTVPNVLAYRSLSGHTYAQVHQTTIDSETTYWIVVNGKISQITYIDTNGIKQPYKSVNHENQITVSGAPYTGSLVGQTPLGGGYYQMAPYVDIDAGSVNITRIFTSASSKHILIGYDVFPVTINHNLEVVTHDGYANLEADYDASLHPFPPGSDGTYTSVQDRQWLLFNNDGSLASSLKTPTVNNDGKTLVNRVNGICLLEE